MNVMVDGPATAADDAASVVVCAVPGVRLKVAGVAVTPAGRPVMATATVPVNPLIAVAVTLAGDPAAPGAMVSEVGDTASV